MGTAKDLVDLTTQLIERIKDRKEVPEWLKVLSMIHTVCSENGVLQQTKLQLESRIAEIENKYALLDNENQTTTKQNLEYKQKITELEERITKISQPNKPRKIPYRDIG